MVKVEPESELIEGRVLRAESGRFMVDSGEEVIPCRLRGRIKREAQLQVRSVVVGDRVLVRLTGSQPRPESEGVIEELLPRDNQLSRATSGGGRKEQVLMANLDRVFVVMAVAEPEFNSRLLDRFLVGLAHQDLDAFICVNKCDLVPELDRLALASSYRDAGYPVLMLSALTGEGLEGLKEAMRERTSFFLGPSGAGKSTLLKSIQPGLEVATRSVSRSSGKGRHTTSYTELHGLEFGGHVADSPGLREFGLWGLKEGELAACFPEFRAHVDGCRYPNCSHSHEPECSLKEAVERGEVDGRRHDSYLRILKSIREGDLSF